MQGFRESSLAEEVTGERGDERVRRVGDSIQRLAERRLRLMDLPQLVERQAKACSKLGMYGCTPERSTKMLDGRLVFSPLAFQIAEHVMRFDVIRGQRDDVAPSAFSIGIFKLAAEGCIQPCGLDIKGLRRDVRFCDA